MLIILVARKTTIKEGVLKGALFETSVFIVVSRGTKIISIKKNF